MRQNLFKLSIAIILLLGVSQIKAEKVIQNILHEDYFGFEKADDGWWFYDQPESYWGASGEQVQSGLFSMKFTHPDLSSVGYALKGQMASSSKKGALFEVPAGTHDISMHVYIEPGSTFNNFQLTIKGVGSEPWISLNWRLDTVATGQWVKLVNQIVLPTDRRSAWQIIVPSGESGGGTFYIDNFSILGEVEVPTLIPDVSTIETNLDSVSLDLDSGNYNMRLKVWKEVGSSIKLVSAGISNPAAGACWDISNIAEGEWVVLEQKITVHTNVVDAQLMITVPNNPIFGGGLGAVFIDDIVIEVDDSPNTNYSPIAIASVDVSFVGDTSFTIDGAASYDIDGDDLSYNWTVPGDLTIDNPTAIAPIITVSGIDVEADYEIVLTVSDQLATSSDTILVSVSPAIENAVVEDFLSAVTIFPNPTENDLNLTGLEHVKQVLIRSIEGKVVVQKKVSGDNITLQLGHLSKGLYIIEFVLFDGSVSSDKVMVK